MARYEREFLIPYLEDIYALHLSKQKLLAKKKEANRQISKIKQEALNSVSAPDLEEEVTHITAGGAGEGVLGAIGFVLTFILFFVSLTFDSPAGLLLPLFSGAISIYLMVHANGSADRANEEIRKRNDEKEAKHAIKEMAALSRVRKHVKEVEKGIAIYETEITKVDSLLEQLYNVNVIPKWYRDIYSAVYLYDWFSNSRADDLDVALNTLVLEQIKERLDLIIKNQGEMILNQRVIIANQYKTMDMLEEHHKQLISKLNNIQMNINDQNMYLGMIEANTAANAYFSVAYYLK